jgi:branched-chain amino acid transport system ATP-binding protein
MLQIDNLSAGYDGSLVLRNVSLRLAPNRISVLMGPNGAGKSTLLKSIYGLTNISAGEILFRETKLNDVKTHQMSPLGITYLPQGRINFTGLTVEDNLFMGARLLTKNKTQKQIRKIYDEFPVLNEKKNVLALNLSGGQQQILAIGRAMISMPSIILMDEPSLGLSPKLIKQIFNDISRLNRVFNTTFLIVEHNIKSVLKIADYCYVINNGQIKSHGNVEKMKQGKTLQKVFMGEYE